jgi:hypothetical protein
MLVERADPPKDEVDAADQASTVDMAAANVKSAMDRNRVYILMSVDCCLWELLRYGKGEVATTLCEDFHVEIHDVIRNYFATPIA